ncbi:YlbF family regulator [Dendrosporobacter sp. 1207_IL3150]|uniref:YlbF family regulator n=1 Tax=Dendrosporobacter sp. 1207_IL3150 TaxID=3084054 RepID=UPI002FD8DE98
MTTYDKAHELAKALKNSDEYRSFLAAKNSVEADAQAKQMVQDFIARQMEVQYEMMSGKPEDKNKVEQLQKMYELLIVNSKAKDFVHAHMRFNQIIGDIYKIIGDSVAEGMDFFAKE